MACYPENRFAQEFAKRTLKNLRDIKVKRPLEFQDTALLNAMLAVFVLPHERSDDQSFMSELLEGYDKRELDEIVTVLRQSPGKQEASELPETIGDLPRFLRNSVAHLNVKPESANGQSLTHILVWNNSRSGKTTFVARLHIARLRSLAIHVLEQLSKWEGDRYDGIDPIAKFDEDNPELAITNKPKQMSVESGRT